MIIFDFTQPCTVIRISILETITTTLPTENADAYLQSKIMAFPAHCFLMQKYHENSVICLKPSLLSLNRYYR